MNMKKLILIITAILLATVSSIVAGGRYMRSSWRTVPPIETVVSSADNKDTSTTKPDVLIGARNATVAPELSTGDWIISEPLNLSSLRGRVVVVDFWTFACYNCRNTLPAIKRWNERYGQKAFTIIGVHTPEMDSERVLSNVQAEVKSLGIHYPVITDNNYDTWRAYGINAWPTIVILDKQGRVRFMHVGEGYYEEMEKVIQKLLAESD